MKIVALNKPVKGLIFDVDLTLYDNREYYDSQNRLLVERLARELGKSVEEMSRQIESFQKEYTEDHDGQRQSMGNVLVHFGMDYQKNIDWRNEMFEPEKYLRYDKHLYITFTLLASRFRIAAVTNNTSEIARRTLKILELEEFFISVIGIDESRVSKPHYRPFEIAANRLHIPLEEIVSIGDRMNVDIEIPVQKGMGGILVESLKDVYKLPALLG